MSDFNFKIISRDNKSQAKYGQIKTNHNVINTPAFVPVGSGASIKSLTPQEIKSCNIDVIFVNTYHMIFRPGTNIVKKMGGLHKFMNWKGSIMTDSGGFQAFSLGEHGPKRSFSRDIPLVKINDEGINFKSIWDGRNAFLSPKKSINAQQELDSDIMMSFDECTFYPIAKNRAKLAMERTHRWTIEGLKEKNNKQALYGIVQGSVFKDLRQQSAKFISKLPFDGFAIGSVANSKEPREKVFAVLDWTLPLLLPFGKPVHFLGIGEVEDIFVGVDKGIDSFDCVTPTRMGRMGWVFSLKSGLKNKFRYDITKSEYSQDQNPLEKGCKCFACEYFTRGYLNHLFRNRELLAYRLASYHNLYFFGNLMKNIREAICMNQFRKLKIEWIGR